MIIVISPSKKLSFDETKGNHTTPAFLDETNKLIKELKHLSPQDISQLMGLSQQLSDLNFDRFQSFEKESTPTNARQALFAFKGDVYDGLDADSLGDNTVTYAQNHLRMLSGLYGLLRPLDLIQPYRLEMGTKFQASGHKNLYGFWGSKITDSINQVLQQHQQKTLVNLASNEYFKAVKPKEIDGNVVTINFKQIKDGQPKSIMIYTKRARGQMARYLLEQQIESADGIKDFSADGYSFDKAGSSEDNLLFTKVV